MDKEQSNKNHMIQATLAFLDSNASEWQSIAKIGAVKNELNQISIAINDAAEEQGEAKNTIGKTKLDLKIKIAEKADVINDLLEVQATINGDDETARQMSDSKSSLVKMPYDTLILKTKQIIDLAKANEEALTAEYGLNSEQITDLEADINRLLELSGQPRAYQIKSSIATREIDELLKQAHALLTQKLDKLLKLFSSRNASFYAGYLKARMIVNL